MRSIHNPRCPVCDIPLARLPDTHPLRGALTCLMPSHATRTEAERQAIARRLHDGVQLGDQRMAVGLTCETGQ